MNIFIPTLGRIEKQTTWDNLTPKLRKDTLLVVHKDEAKEHRERGRNVLVSPVQGKGMPRLRQWIMDYARSQQMRYIAMADDDLAFQVRRPNDFKIVNSTPEQVEEAFFWMRLSLRSVAHCAMSPRSLAYDDPAEYMEAVRGIQCVAYDVHKAKEVGARFDKDVPEWFLMEDFHMTLQLLRAGLPNRVSLTWRINPGPPNAQGGASTIRNIERHTKAAQLLAQLHPGVVRLREKKMWGVGDVKVYDVTVAWKQALKFGASSDDEGAEK